MRIAFIAQARMTSSRLPGKVLIDVCGEPVLYRMIERMRLTSHKNVEIIIATTTNKEDDIIVSLAEKYKVKVYRGSEKNVLSRYYFAAKKNNIDIISRVTCDDLLFDPRWSFDNMLENFIKDGNIDYCSTMQFNGNNEWIDNEPCWGCYNEIFTFSALEKAYFEAKDPYCIEHVTPYFYMNPNIFKCKGFPSDYKGYNTLPDKFGTSLDTDKDLKLLRIIYENLYINNKEFSINDVIKLYLIMPNLSEIIKTIGRTQVTYHGESDFVTWKN